MNADELHDAVAANAGLSRDHVDAVLSALQETVKTAVQRNEDVCLPGFGTWHRSTTSCAFEWTVPIEPGPEYLGFDYKDGSGNPAAVLQIAEYVRRESSGAGHDFTIDSDPFPTVVPASHPGSITREELENEIGMLRARHIDMKAIGDQIVRSFRGE